MTGVIILLGIVTLYAVGVKLLGLDFKVPDPFACGYDETCYCNKADNCIKKK